MSDRFRTVSSRGTSYIVSDADAVAVGVIGSHVDVCHYERHRGEDVVGDRGGMCCPVAAVLIAVDRANLNTTANALRTELLEAMRTIEALRKKQ